jgi:hypothetical protein
MATNILGLFTTPDQYQANQMAQFRQQSANEVQLDPFQQAAIGMRQAGYQLGGGIGGALGGQDPQLQIIARRQALAGQLDPSNPQSYMQVAKMAADAGDQQFAIAIADAGRTAMSEMALTQQRLREKQGAEPFEQLVRTGKYTPASLATYKTSQNVADLELIEKPIKERNIAFGAEAERKSKSMFGKAYADLTSDEAGKVDKEVEKSEREKATKINVGVDVKGQEAGAIESAKLDAKRLDEARTSSAKAQDQKQILATMQQALPNIVSGTGAQARTSFLNLLQTAGLASPEDQNKLASSELFNSLAGERVLSFIKTLGTNPTDTDREFARTIGPALEKGTKSNKDLIDYLSKRADSIIANASSMEQHYFDNKYSLRGFKQRNDVIPIPSSSQGGWSIKKKP